MCFFFFQTCKTELKPPYTLSFLAELHKSFVLLGGKQGLFSDGIEVFYIQMEHWCRQRFFYLRNCQSLLSHSVRFNPIITEIWASAHNMFSADTILLLLGHAPPDWAHNNKETS